MRRLPGYLRVDLWENVPYGCDERLQEGMWCPAPIVNQWARAGAELVLGGALVWERHRRWLDPHVNLLRSAREALMRLGTRPARAVLELLKDLWARMFGGLLRSDTHNHGATLNPAWSDMINATAQARMLMAVDKTQVDIFRPQLLVGVHVDAAWWTVPADQPVHGLELSTQLGKWKESGRTPWTMQLHQAHSQREHQTLRRSLGS